ncbi:MAG: Methionyl-tRNA formyltransferase [Syntrophus sp. SKADARSKE-3]|nr:Methionyl-tRNA formyltransferase [Syntrophus sp. SKADARSKE-3]MDQ5987706.1 Methionyl-tRNA formyltransferase [Syntrophus sp. SKADARSKE-3]
MPKPKVLFMGTPEFAVPSLSILIENDYPIAGVVTQPDKPQGRGRRLSPSPIKVLALDKGLPLFQPDRVRDETFLRTFRTIGSDVVVVAAFGQILPRVILEEPPWGCINVHPSLLPKYRGATPMNWTLINGEEITGVTIMCVNEGVDTGDILLQQETPVAPDETYNLLHDRLAKMGADLLLRTLQDMETGRVQGRHQDNTLATFAPRLKKEDGLIRWQDNARKIACLVRGLSPTPGAYTFLNGKMLRIFMATADETAVADAAGTIGPLSEKGLRVSAGDGYVYIRDLQLEGKKRMPVQEFLRGFRLPESARLG